MADFERKLQTFLDRWNTLTSKEGETDDVFNQEFTVSVTEEANCSRIGASQPDEINADATLIYFVPVSRPSRR